MSAAIFCLALSNPENWPIAETAQVVVCVLLKYSSREASNEPASQLLRGAGFFIPYLELSENLARTGTTLHPSAGNLSGPALSNLWLAN